jgi:hypothetical protein
METTIQPERQTLDVKDSATELGVCEETIRRLVRRKVLRKLPRHPSHPDPQERNSAVSKQQSLSKGTPSHFRLPAEAFFGTEDDFAHLPVGFAGLQTSEQRRQPHGEGLQQFRAGSFHAQI